MLFPTFNLTLHDTCGHLIRILPKQLPSRLHRARIFCFVPQEKAKKTMKKIQKRRRGKMQVMKSGKTEEALEKLTKNHTTRDKSESHKQGGEDEDMKVHKDKSTR